MFYKNKSNSTIVSIITIINGNVNAIYYDPKDVVLPSLRSISHNYYKTMSSLYIPMKEHDSTMDKNVQRESIEFEVSVSIGTKYNTYDYNEKVLDSI